MEDKKKKLSVDEAKVVQRNFRAIGFVSILTITTGVVAMMYLEGWSFINSFYFSVVSLTTVGYGDLTPDTDGGKLFVTFYLIVGIAIIAALINNVLKGLVARRILKRADEKSDESNS